MCMQGKPWLSVVIVAGAAEAGPAGRGGAGGRGGGNSPWCCRAQRPARAPGVAGDRVGGVETVRADYRSYRPIF